MSDTIVLPLLALGFAVGVVAGGLIWLHARRSADDRTPSDRDFRTLFASGAALFSAGIVLSVVFAVLAWSWYVPALLLAVGLVNMAVSWARRRQWQGQ